MLAGPNSDITRLQVPTGKWDEQITVEVLLTPRPDGRRPWNTTMIAIAGDLGLSDEEVSTLRDAFDAAAIRSTSNPP